MPNGKNLFDRIAFKSILGLFATGMENITMSLPMSGIVSHDGMPLILYQGFQLNSKRNDFLAFGLDGNVYIGIPEFLDQGK